MFSPRFCHSRDRAVEEVRGKMGKPEIWRVYERRAKRVSELAEREKES